ncbi:hypothetical protein R1sor_005935 [Riccia sorocarpa]|uniref:Uncharacterized protein n=1 Tax=Riccia sorocarpa TaxID=122646 RepID=A0ABD3HSI0_9MARC
MGPSLLHRHEVKEKITVAWNSHPPRAGTAQRKWQIGWIRIREILRAENRQAKAEGRQIYDLRLEVSSLRMMLEEDENPILIEQLRRVEDDLRKMEQAEARAWRLRSRQRWLREGEAPSRYFYAQAKAKFARESIQKLKLEDGSYTTDTGQIISELEKYYTSLYTRQEFSEQDLNDREEALALLSKRVTAQQDQQGVFEAKKADGGLGWPPLSHMATAFLLRNVTKLLQDGDEDWIKIAQSMILHALRNSAHTNEVKSWGIMDVLLGLNSFTDQDLADPR